MEMIRKADGFKNEKILVLPGEFLKSARKHPLVSPLYLTDVGYFPDALHHYRERMENSCPQYIMIFCTKGKGFLTLSSRTKAISENTMFVIPKGEAHCYKSDEKEPWSIYWVHFSGEKAPYFVNKLSTENPYVHISLEKSAIIKLLFNEIINNIEKGYTYENMVYVSQLLAHLLGLVFFSMEDLNSATPEEKDLPIEESIGLMNNNLDKKFSLKQLAQHANLSVTQYSLLFKEKIGFSPVNYFIRLKIQRACQYLDLTDLKVSEIAGKLGFSDPYYFSRTFYKVMHYSPKAYRDIKKG
jgi:AraC-like DNA-binding protein/mannose-6-phosphate isomerase-like protein (cupin superfamily)